MRIEHGAFTLDDAVERLEFQQMQHWLAGAYWSPGITRADVERGFRHSALVIGAYGESGQVGCLRVVSDCTRFAYLMDVYVEPSVRGYGLGRAMVTWAIGHPDLALVSQWLLGTADAHEVYRPLGFSEIANPSRYMELRRPRAWS